MIDVGSAVAYLDLDTTKFTSGISSALQQLNAIANISSTAGQKISAFGNVMSTTGSSLTKYVTAPIAGLGTAAIKLASDFESSMSKVQAISGSNVEQMDALTDKAIEMGAKTKFSAKESADAFTYMAMAGWKAEDMIDGIGGIMSLAAADGLDLATTSDIVTDALTAFGLQASDSAHFADVLAQASSSANTNVSMLGESFKYVAPVAGSLGYSVEDIAVALGLMANAGIKGSQAGTTLRAAMTRMIEPTDKAAAAMEKYGVTLTNEDGTMKSYAEVMDMLRDKLGGLSEAEQTKTATILFGQEAMSGMLSIINASEKDYNNLTDAIANSEGRADSMAETMMDNLGGAIEQLMGALESLAIKFGTALTPMIRKFAEFITQVVENLNKMSDAEVQQIIQIAGVVTAIGPLLLIMGKLVTSVGNLMTFASSLPAMLSSISTILPAIAGALGPVLLVVGAITGFIAVLKKLYEENEEFRTSIQEIWNEISTNVTGVVDSLKETFSLFKESLGVIPETLQSTFDRISPDLGDSVIQLIESLRGAFELIQPVIEGFAEVFGGIFLTLVSVGAGVLNGLLAALSPLVDLVSESIDFFINLGEALKAVFSGDYEGAAESIGKALENVKEWIASLLEALVEFIGGFAEGFWESLKELFGAFGVDVEEFFVTIWDTVVEFFTNVKDSIVEFVLNLRDSLINFVEVTIPEFIESVKEWFNNLPYNIGVVVGKILGYFYQLGVDLINWVTEDIPAFFKKLGEFFTSLPEKFVEWLAAALLKIVEWGTDLKEQAIEAGQGFIDSITTFFEELPDKFTAWLEDAVETFNDFLEDMKEAGKNLIASLGEGLKEAWEGILDWFDGIGQTLSDFWQGVKDGFSSVTEEASSVKNSVSGSHANGLSYVPYNGYIAELHEGERVLTKQETRDYNSGRMSEGNTFNFYGTEKLDQRGTEEAFERMLKEFELLT